MPEAAKVEEVYSAIEESARLLNIAVSREKIWPILSVYREALADSVIVFAISGGRHAGEIDYSILMHAKHGDPYRIALSNGFTRATDHPVGTLLSDIGKRCPIGMYAIDAGVRGGFKKTYTFFPTDDLQVMSKLADIPSMPRSLAENEGIFARYGLGGAVNMTSIDYRRKSVNLYFGNLPDECLEPKAILSMFRELGLPEPGERALEFARKSFSIYPTFSWDSGKIQRICFAVITTDPTEYPAQVEPDIAKFAKNAPYSYTGKRTLVYGTTFSASEEYYKVGAYYQVDDRTRNLVKAFEALKD